MDPLLVYARHGVPPATPVRHRDVMRLESTDHLSLLAEALWNAHFDVARVLMRRGARFDLVHPQFGCPLDLLMRAAASRHPEGDLAMAMLREAVSARLINPIEDQSRPVDCLHMAIRTMNLEAYDLLVAAGWNPNRPDDRGLTAVQVLEGRDLGRNHPLRARVRTTSARLN